MRLRLPELLKEHDLTAYALAKASKGHLSLRAAYRLVAERGRVRYLDANASEAICRALAIGPEELFELDGFQGPKERHGKVGETKKTPRAKGTSRASAAKRRT